MRSRGGQHFGKPWGGEALVVFGDTFLPDMGPFSVEFPSGLFLTGFATGHGEVVNLRGHLDGRPLDLPSWCLVFTSPTLPSVAGGPADPGAWDRWFGDMNAFAEGDAEAEARAKKAEALPADLAALYTEVRAQREQGALDEDRLMAIQATLARFPEDWLLKAEVGELLEMAHA
jgi:phenylalanine-4-hydroxylase